MDIDEFLDRELSDLGLQTDKTEKENIELPDFKEQLEPSPLVENIKANLSKGNLEQAELSYVQLWHILLQQKLKWNKELYEQLSALSKQFSSALNNAYNDAKRKADHIYELINRARAALKEGKKELPFKIYSEVQEINNSIPNVFFEEKKIIEEQIMDFYKELRNTTDNELVKRVSALMHEMNQLIDKINSSIRANDFINAIVNYNKCIELYNQVPEGFLRHKNSIGMRILEIYKGLSIYTEISNLQKQLNLQSSQFQQQIIAPNVHTQIKPDTIGNQNVFSQTVPAQTNTQTKSILLNSKKTSAKEKIKMGFYNEASRDIQEALQLEPNDAEAKAIHAKIKTLQ
ncbi:hypothetical protein HYX00_00740 [Candidatus Woesearchaeota archaeon]|nr:hypothetical protein [Candidatus Woesearchaeota archaeon]